MNVGYARVSPISPLISDMKKPHPIRSRYSIFRTLSEIASASTSLGYQSLRVSPVITISSTYTTSKILFPCCIRQNTQWSFSIR